MDNEKEDLTREEEECRPLTDEEFKEYQEKERRKEKKTEVILSAIWDAISFFT